MADEQWMTEEFNAESGDTTDFVYRPAFESARTNEDGDGGDRRMCRSVLERQSELKLKDRNRVFYSGVKTRTGDRETYADGSSTEKESIKQSCASNSKDINRYVRDSSLKRMNIK